MWLTQVTIVLGHCLQWGQAVWFAEGVGDPGGGGSGLFTNTRPMAKRIHSAKLVINDNILIVTTRNKVAAR